VPGPGIPGKRAGVVFVSGFLFLLLTWVGVREKVIESIPRNLRLGRERRHRLFITFIGCQNLKLIVRTTPCSWGSDRSPHGAPGLGGSS